MAKLKKYKDTIIIGLFLGMMFYLGIVPLRDFDIWFHIKSGELILQKGIIHYDVFSYNTAGREWFPYEWLFQVGVARIEQWFGFEAIKYVIAAVITILMGVYLAILRKIIRLPLMASIVISFIFLVSVYEFASARPHIVAYTFLIVNLFFVLLYVVRDKNWLWVTLPITILWANMHGSIFLDIAIFGAYAGVALINFFIYKTALWLQKARTLGVYTIITVFLTVLPPLGILQYRLLWMFFKNNQVMSRFIDEWTPISSNPYAFRFYTISMFVVVILFALTLYRKKTITPLVTLLPIIIFPLLPYTASRNAFLGYITLGLLAGYVLKLLELDKRSRWIKVAVWIILLLLVAYHADILMKKRTPVKLYYPINATKFLKLYHFNGHMFNEYGYGGYLLYQLYPAYQVFYDGRTDLYFQREMPDTLALAIHKNDPDDQFKKLMDSLWGKYDISFVILRTEKHSVLRKIQRILSADPQWSLVFWDDYTQIFVRRDGKNDAVIQSFGTVAATPYDQNPIRNNQIDQALAEYTRMNKITDSGHSRNAIGYINLLRGKFDDAKQVFEQAISLDPSFESPLMNLAEIYAKDNDLATALALYQRAQQLAPDRGLIYIRLGQLVLAQTGDKESVKKIWEDGVNLTIDTDARNQLKQLLSTL